MCNMAIFFLNFQFHTIKTGTLTPEFDFLNSFPIFSSKKTNSWGLCPGLNCVKMDSKIFKKNNHVADSIPDGRDRKKIKSKIGPGVLFTGSSGTLNI